MKKVLAITAVLLSLCFHLSPAWANNQNDAKVDLVGEFVAVGAERWVFVAESGDKYSVIPKYIGKAQTYAGHKVNVRGKVRPHKNNGLPFFVYIGRIDIL